MTQHEPHERAAYEAFRDGFGAELVGAVREREAPRRPLWRRRAWMGLPALAAAAVAFTLIDLSSKDDTPVLSAGAASAAAAVQELSDSLERGVLVRVALNRQRSEATVTTESDWTDLATRARRTRLQSADADVEYWNPSPHERWTIDRRYEAADGRAVVSYSRSDAENSSSSATPIEEIDELLRLARDGDLTLRRADGALVVERTERCFTSVDQAFMECPDPSAGPDARWPDDPPGELKAVTAFQRWWLADDGRPRLLRHENGTIDAGGDRRDVAFRTDYRRWEVLSPTEQNLRLAHPPAFGADRYLVLKGPDTFGAAVRDGRVRCVERC